MVIRSIAGRRAAVNIRKDLGILATLEQKGDCPLLRLP